MTEEIDFKKVLKEKHERALERLRSLKFGEKVEISVIDNCSLEGIITVREAWDRVYSDEQAVLTTAGYYLGHDKNFILLSSDKIEDVENDRGNISVMLTKYVVKVVRLKEVRK